MILLWSNYYNVLSTDRQYINTFPSAAPSHPPTKQVQSVILGHTYLWPHSMGLKAPYQGAPSPPQELEKMVCRALNL